MAPAQRCSSDWVASTEIVQSDSKTLLSEKVQEFSAAFVSCVGDVIRSQLAR